MVQAIANSRNVNLIKNRRWPYQSKEVIPSLQPQAIALARNPCGYGYFL